MSACAVFSFSRSFSRPGVVALATAARHLPEEVDLVVASTGLSLETETVLAEQAALTGRQLTFVSSRQWVDSLPSLTRYVADTWARVFIGEMLPTQRRVLYLDADTVTIGPLGPLFEMSLDGAALAALPDPMMRTFSTRGADYTSVSGRPASTPYFNTGVLVIDPTRWVDLDVAGRARSLVEDGRLPLDYVDQDVLNVVLAGHWRSIESRFHHLVSGPEAALAGVGDAALLHFTGPVKPWEIRDRSNPLAAAYRAAAAAGGWKW